MTTDITADALFVPTDRHGRQFHHTEETIWSLPSRGGADGADSAGGTNVGGAVERRPATGHVRLLSLDALLEELGERIFVAVGSGPTAELVDETAWSVLSAARFALDCAEHVCGDAGSVALPTGETLADVIASGRRYLDDASDTEAGLFTRISRLAEGRRVGKRAQEVGDLAFDAAIDDEVADRFIFEDERWTAIASVRDAMLAAIEAIHHASFPRIIEAENVVYEVGQSRGMHHTTSRLSGGIVPAWVLATEAAERARQAAKDAGGSEGGKSERAWQRERLAQALRGA